MNFLKQLLDRLKSTRIYIGWVARDILQRDSRILHTGLRERTRLEVERTTYATVYGAKCQIEMFRGPWIDLESAMLRMSWHLGINGVEESRSAKYTTGLWNALCACGSGYNEFKGAMLPVINSVYWGYMSQEDVRYLRSFLPTFSKYLKENNMASVRIDRLSLYMLTDFLESYACH